MSGRAKSGATSTRVLVCSLAIVVEAIGIGCGGAGSNPTSPPCDQSCMDDVAITSFRDVLKLAFNLTLQGKPVGGQDASAPCPLGGSVHITGTATSNADQGTTTVDLTYVLKECAYSQVDTDPTQTFSMTLTGTATETGMLSAQPSSTTALEIQSSSMTLSGTVYAPALAYDAGACAIMLGQDGSDIGGTLCGRPVGASL
jgi:hypothetical protein